MFDWTVYVSLKRDVRVRPAGAGGFWHSRSPLELLTIVELTASVAATDAHEADVGMSSSQPCSWTVWGVGEDSRLSRLWPLARLPEAVSKASIVCPMFAVRVDRVLTERWLLMEGVSLVQDSLGRAEF